MHLGGHLGSHIGAQIGAAESGRVVDAMPKLVRVTSAPIAAAIEYPPSVLATHDEISVTITEVSHG